MRRRRLEKLSTLPLRSQTDPTPPKTTPTKDTVMADASATSSSAPNIPRIVTEDDVRDDASFYDVEAISHMQLLHGAKIGHQPIVAKIPFLQ